MFEMADKLVMKTHLFDYIYFFYQGIINDFLLIIGYILIYRRFRDYHNAMIARSQHIYTEEDIYKIK